MALNNRVTLTGNLGGEARIHDKEGKLFAAFSLATRDSYKNGDEEWQEKKVVWHNVLTFNPNLVQLLKTFKKGARIEVTGALSYKQFPHKLKGGKTVNKREASVIAHKIDPKPIAKKQKASAPEPA